MVTAKGRSRPARILGSDDTTGSNRTCICAEEPRHGRPLAAIRHVNHVHPSQHLEQLARDVRGEPDATRAEINDARVCLNVGDKLGIVFAGNEGRTTMTKGP